MSGWNDMVFHERQRRRKDGSYVYGCERLQRTGFTGIVPVGGMAVGQLPGAAEKGIGKLRDGIYGLG